MSRSKKTKFTPGSSSSTTVDFRTYLKNPQLEADYLRLSQLDIIPGRFIKYDDFYDYDIMDYLRNCGLYNMFSSEVKDAYYPFLIYLFYTNLAFEDNENKTYLASYVKGVHIKLSIKNIGRILSIPYSGLTLDEIVMDDEDVLDLIFLPGQHLPMTNNKLKPIPRLIGRILSYNICPKTGSYNYYSRELSSCVYAIMAGHDVNWAKIIFDTMVKFHSSHLPFGAFLTPIFRKYNVDLASEETVVKSFEFFDRAAINRMKLPEFPSHEPQQPPSNPPSPPHGPSTSSQPDPPPTQPNPYADAFYNSMSAQIASLQSQQQNLLDSHSRILENQSMMMTRLQSIESTQSAIISLLKIHHPPPPPGSED